MTTKFVGALFVLAFLGFGTSGLAEELKPWQQEILDEHNALRSKCGVPPLVWSYEAAPGAQEWADRCKFDHTPQQGPGYFGENLGAGNEKAADVVDGWYAEIANYDYSNPGYNMGGKTTGHFTQVVWKDTRQLACGMALCKGLLPSWGDTPVPFWVCRYSPPGNMGSGVPPNPEYQQNVPEACPH